MTPENLTALQWAFGVGGPIGFLLICLIGAFFAWQDR